MAKKAAQPKSSTSSEFAIIQTGGKQYKVTQGDVLTIEKLDGYKKGDTVIFDKVLLVENTDGTTIGDPYIKGAEVKAEFITTGKGDKIRIVKYKAKSRHLKQSGHRQPYSKVLVTDIK